LRKFAHSIILSLNLLALLSAPVAFAAEKSEKMLPTYKDLRRGTCLSILSRAELTDVYRSHRYKNEDLIPEYALQRPRADFVHDQCQIGSCWAQAITALWEYRIKKATGKAVRLSPEFILRNRLFERSTNRHLDGWKVQVSSGEPLILEGLRSVDRSGIVPSRSFSTRFPFKNFRSVVKRLEVDLNVLIAYHRGQLNQSDEEVNAALKTLLSQYFVEPPVEVFFQRKKISPTDLAAVIAKESQAPTHLVEIRAEKMGVDRFLIAIAKHMRAFDEPVVMMMRWDEAFYDSVNALMTVTGFATLLPNDFAARNEAVSKIAKSLYGDSDSRHVVLVWDYATSVEEPHNVDALLALNSWGRSWGDGGYVNLFKSYLQHASPVALVDESVLESSD